jgi:hypothetical protein
MLSNKKGQIRTLEALLAVILIFSALTLSVVFSPVTNVNNQGALANLGLNALIEFDENGNLGKLIDQNNWTVIEQTLNVLLPMGVFYNLTVYNELMQPYNLTVYNELMQPINNCTISNGGLGSPEVVSVQYLCASQGTKCHCYFLRLQLALTG